MMRRLYVLGLLLALFQMGPAQAARLALLIGNDSYAAAPQLKNARADADAMAVALRRAGYQVTLVKDRTLRQMKDDVRQLKMRIRGGDEVVLFYSGHGVQIGAMNYLLPVDVRSDSEDQVRDDGLALSSVLEELRAQKPALTLAIIDACRDNPFKGSGRAIGGRGLTGVSGATGQMVIYSAGEGQQALDRLGDNDPVKNGLFTRVFVREMEAAGVSVDQVARKVREEVNRLARHVRHDQVPAIYDQVLGQFYFYAPATVTIVAAPAADPALAIEAQDWQAAQGSDTVAAYQAYMAEYPRGLHLSTARIRLATLKEARQAAAQGSAIEPTVAPVARPASSAAAGASFHDCADCPEMVVIPAGKGIAGFALGQTEVTQGQWQALMGSNPSHFKQCGADCPVEYVSWNDAQQFIVKLNAGTGKAYRLPTEQEWEYACLAGRKTEYCGGNVLGEVGWYNDNSDKKTHKAKGKQANAFGLYDMSGNVAEWTDSCWEGRCALRVVRSGSYGESSQEARAASRSGVSTGGQSYISGFRLARTAP